MRRFHVLQPGGLSNFLHSIRFRLSLWFVLVLAFILLIFSTFVYYRQTQAVYDQTTARLNIRMRDLELVFRQANSNDHDERGWLRAPGTAPGSPFVLQSNEVLVLSDQNGKPADVFGPVSSAQATQLAALAPNIERSKVYIRALSSNQGSQPTTYLFLTATVGVENHLLGWVTLGQPLDPDGQLPRLFWTLLLAGLVTLLLAMIGGYWLADRTLRPVKSITRTARSISESDLSQRLNIRTQDELGELAGTFDQMLNRLQAAFTRQRQFTADASHELRTPLTIIGLETSRALDSARTVNDYRHSMEVI